MTVIDISQEVFSCQVFPGDPKPEKTALSSVADGDACNLTAFSMCAHNGTHVDAPYHFVESGKTIDELDVSVFVGDAYVARHEGNVTVADAQGILALAAAENAAERILIAGHATVTAEAARADGYRKYIMFLHYPPTSILENESCFTRIAEEYRAEQVVYAHSHGETRFRDSVLGEKNGVRYSLVSGDFLKWTPAKIL